MCGFIWSVHRQSSCTWWCLLRWRGCCLATVPRGWRTSWGQRTIFPTLSFSGWAARPVNQFRSPRRKPVLMRKPVKNKFVLANDSQANCYIKRFVKLICWASHPITRLTSFRREKRFNFLFRVILGSAENHSARLHSFQLARLQVAQDDHETIAHLLDRDIIDETGNDGLGSGLAEVDFLDIERFGFGMIADVDDAADSNVKTWRDNWFFSLKLNRVNIMTFPPNNLHNTDSRSTANNRIHRRWISKDLKWSRVVCSKGDEQQGPVCQFLKYI